jgi:hypothetical protein
MPSAVAHVPQLEPVQAGEGEHAAVGAEGDSFQVRVRKRLLLATGHVPQDGPFVAGQDERAAVRAEGEAKDPESVLHERRAQGTVIGHPPDPSRAVVTCRGQSPAVRAEDDAGETVGVAGERQAQLAAVVDAP